LSIARSNDDLAILRSLAVITQIREDSAKVVDVLNRADEIAPTGPPEAAVLWASF
jgi:hypothetical protein